MSDIKITFTFVDLLWMAFVMLPGVTVFLPGALLALVSAPARLRRLTPPRILAFFAIVAAADFMVAALAKDSGPLVDWYFERSAGGITALALLRLALEAVAAAAILRWAIRVNAAGAA